MPFMKRRKLRLLCRLLVLALAVCQTFTNRYATDADGTAYVDVARAWLRSDWVHALNSYWSPLIVWFYALEFKLFSPSVHWQLPLMHVVALAGFVAALIAWEWLTFEWELWQGPSSHPMLTDSVGYCVVAWAGLRLTGLGWFLSADIFVIALLLVATAILVRVRRGVAINRDFVLLGTALGLGFLAKTAFITVIPILLGVLAVLLRSWTNRRVFVAALMAFVVITPFVVAISIVKGQFTIGDSGRLNYSWHVSGISVEGYKEGAYLPGPQIRHPIRVLMQNPRVLSFEQHLIGTYPLHSDVAWWCDGYPVRFNTVRQVMILWSNIKFSVKAFAKCPAVLLILLGLPFGAFSVPHRFSQAWFVWAPALIFAASYCVVFSDLRYIAGSYALMGFSLIAAAWNVQLPRWAEVVIFVFLVIFIGWNFRELTVQFIGDITGSKIPEQSYNARVAENMRRLGLKVGDRVAIVGSSLTAAHVGVEGAQIVALIPERISQDPVLPSRNMVFSFEKPDDFWKSSPQTKQRVFEAFRSVGARWVFSESVPEWADLSGWNLVGEAPFLRLGDRRFTYYQKL